MWDETCDQHPGNLTCLRGVVQHFEFLGWAGEGPPEKWFFTHKEIWMPRCWGSWCHLPLLADHSPFPLLLQFPTKSSSAELMPAKPFLSCLLFLLGPSPAPWFLGLIYLAFSLPSHCTLHLSVICTTLFFSFFFFILSSHNCSFYTFFLNYCFPFLFCPCLFPSRYIAFRKSSSVEYLKYIFALMRLLFLTYWMCLLYCPYLAVSYTNANLEGLHCFLSIGMQLKDG